MKIPKTAQSYSCCIKKLQIAVIIFGIVLAIMQTIKLFGHVEMHVERTPEMERMDDRIENERNRESFDRVQENDNPSERDHERAAQYIDDNFA